jgi:hypothetical protein
LKKIKLKNLVTNFAKKSSDLKPLSVPDISILALSYELTKENKLDEFIRKEPMQIDIVASASQPFKSTNNTQEAKKTGDEKEKNEKNKIDDFPDTAITKLDVDDFPDITKEPICIFSNKNKFLLILTN